MIVSTYRKGTEEEYENEPEYHGPLVIKLGGY